MPRATWFLHFKCKLYPDKQVSVGLEGASVWEGRGSRVEVRKCEGRGLLSWFLPCSWCSPGQLLCAFISPQTFPPVCNEHGAGAR